MVGVETARIADRSTEVARGRAHAQRVGELGHDTILELENLLERPVGLRLGERLPRPRVHDPSGDPEPVAGALVAAHHGAIDMQLGAQRG